VRLLALANPESERVARLQAAAARLGHTPAEIVSWETFLRTPGVLGARSFDVLRIESPGENAQVERLLIAKGAGESDHRFDAPRISRTAALALPDDRGRILFPRQRFLGLRAALREIDSLRVTTMNAPRDIETVGDKPSCHERLVAAGVPRPAYLGTPRCFDELIESMRSRTRLRVFVKLANGSSASGVAAYQTDGRRHMVQTTVAPGLYNSTRVRRLTELAEVRAFFDALCREGVLVEEWIPKTGIGQHAFDLRVVVIAGRACHVAVRTSKTPITNLHLGHGNRRGDAAQVRARLGERVWSGVLETATRALAAFPDSLYAGVDVLITSRGRVCVAEVNAFGDLLRRESFEGRDTYEVELGALSERAFA
jgi:glutathione synthase/RimK-type ligase-like ATP-grasp enzyme